MNTHGHRAALRGLFFDTWMPEYVGAGLGLLFTSIIILLLVVYDHRSTEAFLVHSITPNGAIAALAIISRLCSGFTLTSALAQWQWISISKGKSSLETFRLYGSAARSSLGGLRLLYNLRGRTLASMGALLLFLNLANDAFLQQVISVQQNTIFSQDNATSIYQVLSNSITDRTPDSYMVNPLWQGLTASKMEELKYPAFSCSSGSCLFDDFESLGVCSSCQEVPSTQMEQSSLQLYNYTQNYTFVSMSYGDMSLSNFQNYTEGLEFAKFAASQCPYYVMNATTTGIQSSWVFLNDDRFPGAGNEVMAHGYNEITNFTDPTAPDFILAMSIVNLTNPDSLINWPTNAQLQSCECKLRWCVNRISTNITNNILYQNFTKLAADVSPIFNASDGVLEWPYFNLTSAERTYNVSWAHAGTMSDFLVQNLLGALESPLNTDNYAMFTPPVADVRDAHSSADFSWTEAIEAIYSHGNFTDTFSNIARAMSHELTHSVEKQEIHGSSGYTDSLIVVRWEWLTVPVLTVLSTLFFLLQTIRLSSGRGTDGVRAPLWKANDLPSLFGKLQVLPAPDPTGLATVQAMDNFSEGAEIQLAPGQESLACSTHDTEAGELLQDEKVTIARVANATE